MPILLATKTTFSPPTRVLPRQQAATVTVTVTQTVLPSSDASTGTTTALSGGAIAGIVIGSILGLLLILWLLYSCTNLGAPPSYGPDERRWNTNGRGSDVESVYSRSPHRHRHHHHRHSHHHPRAMREVSERRTSVRPVVVVDGSPRRPASAHYHRSRGRSLSARG